MSVLPIKPPEGFELRKGVPLPDAVLVLDRHAIAIEPSTNGGPAALYAIWAMYASPDSMDEGEDPINGPSARWVDARFFADKVQVKKKTGGGPNQTMHLEGWSARVAAYIEEGQNLVNELLLNHPDMAGYTRAKE